MSFQPSDDIIKIIICHLSLFWFGPIEPREYPARLLSLCYNAICSRYRYITHFYCLAVEAGFYSDMVECLPLDPAAQVRFPPRAVGIFLHPETFGGQCGGFGFKSRVGGVLNLLKAYVHVRFES